MRKLIVVAAVMLGAVMPARGQNACDMLGSWIAADGAWMSTVTGQATASGTITLEFPGLDATLYGTFPSAVRTTMLRGVWERRGGNDFAYTMVWMGVDAAGQAVWVGKLMGTETLIEDCNVMAITASMDVFLGGQNPFSDAPLFNIPLADHNAYRMRVDPPAPGRR